MRLSITVINGRNLRSTQTFGKQDPYVKIKCNRLTRKTRTDENGSYNPNFNSQLIEMGKVVAGTIVTFELWNENSMSDSIIGVGSLSIGECYSGNITVQLEHKNKAAGTLLCHIDLVNTGSSGGGGSGGAMANAGTQLFRQAVAHSPPPPPSAVSRPPPPPQGGGAVMVSQDKSVLDDSNANDILVPLGAGADLRVGLGWDFADLDGDGQGDTDLDLSCVAFDGRGQFMNACYFAEANPFRNGAVQHTGDNRDGKGEGDDETVLLDLDKLTNAGVSALFFVVNSFNGSTFRAVKSASSRLVASQNNTELSYVTMSLEDRNATSLITGRLAMDPRTRQWSLRPMAISSKNTCFADVVPTMQQRLSDIVGRVKIAPPPVGIVMTKGESLPVPSSNFKVGLGWDQVGNPVDLDASVVCMQGSFALADACFFGKLKVFNGALQHSGDNRSGEGAGDDESISVKLNALPSHVQYCCIVVNCYDDTPLNGVRNAYVRLTDQYGNETHRYSLSALGQTSGYIMCTIYRDRTTGQWMVKTNSKEANGNTYKAMLPAIQNSLRQLYNK